MVILDTCALIELTKEEVVISKKTINKINGGAYILSISFAEIACKVKSGKLKINISTEEIHAAYAQIPTIDIVKIGVDEWLQAIHMDWPKNKDPADRLITSFALSKRIPIVTSDKKMKTFYNNVIW